VDNQGEYPLKTILLAAASLAGLPAFAQQPPPPPQVAPPPRGDSGVYIGVGIGGLRIDEKPFDFNPGWGSVQGRLGYAFNKYIAVEGEAMLAFNPYTFDDDGENYDDPDAPDLNSAFGIYAVPSMPIGPNLKLYGRAGYLWTEYEYNSGALNGLVTTSEGPGFGAGLDLSFGDSWSLYFDYTWYGLSNTDDLAGATIDYDADGSLLSIGVTKKF
jgi:hypothetical protein